jgi:peptide chain release factor 1
MDGDLTEVLQALAHAREAEQLEELEMGASIQGGQ